MFCTRLMWLIAAIALIHFVIVDSNEKSSTRSHESRATQVPPVGRQVRFGTSQRDTCHIEEILQLDDNLVSQHKEKEVEQVLQTLLHIYHNSIKPVEEHYNYKDLNRHLITDADILAKPVVLLTGPWSTGKSSMINYLAQVEDTRHNLHTGAEPTTSDFTVVKHGNSYKTVEGLVLVTDKSQGFSSLEKFGQGFLERLQGVEMPYKLLQKVTFVDTPGIIENRKQQERGYPFNEVTKWFVDRADLIFVVFDPTKLDVGIELESLFRQLKGRESQIRLILNKADTLDMQELMRVYGALFWNLAPLINVTEPPRVYTGSFWSKPFMQNGSSDLFIKEETSLLLDLHETIVNRIENKVALLRKHATLVRIHAFIVDKYLQVFTEQMSRFYSNEELVQNIIENPQRFHIFKSVQSESLISKYDLPPAEEYMEFFTINALNTFQPLSTHCPYLSGSCDIDKLTEAIDVQLPQILNAFMQTSQCSSKDCSNKKP